MRSVFGGAIITEAAPASIASRASERIAANQELILGEEIKAAFTEVGPKLDAYIKGAEELSGMAEKDAVAAEAKLPEFLELFEELEESLGKVSELIDVLSRTNR